MATLTLARRLSLPSVLLAFASHSALAVTPGSTVLIGTSGVSAQHMFTGGINKVYILDRVEDNPLLAPDGTHAFGSEYDLRTNTIRATTVQTNTFCAGGSALGNGTWLSAGGDGDGVTSIRILNPCDNDQSCNWVTAPGGARLQSNRWYPTVEIIEDGSAFIIGGATVGAFVNSASRNAPNYEFFPSKGGLIGLKFLEDTLPANHYPLTWSLPSGKLFVQANYGAMVYDYKNQIEMRYPDVPDAVRTYPASAASVMLPLTPANNYTATILFCGGNSLQPDDWNKDLNFASVTTSTSCVLISPDKSQTWVHTDPLPEGRTMGSFIIQPDGNIWLGNGAHEGVAGYATTSWTLGNSEAQDPIFSPVLYRPKQPDGKKWDRTGLTNSSVPRMYHSSASATAQGSIIIAGSNPNGNADTSPGNPFPTEYRVEMYYPSWFNQPRPQPAGIPTQLKYGGKRFEINLPASSLGSEAIVKNISVNILRTGYSTHAIQMGQRMLVLRHSYTYNADGSATLHVRQMPPNAALFPPGPAFCFVVVNGVPSIGSPVMIGDGVIGSHTLTKDDDLPPDSVVKPTSSSTVASVSKTSTKPPSTTSAKPPPPTTTSAKPPTSKVSPPPATKPTTQPPPTTSPTKTPKPTTTKRRSRPHRHSKTDRGH